MHLLQVALAKRELKYCSVVLDRLQVDNKAAGTELEEKEDMNRKGGKLVSRIPTFHKRPANAAPTPEPPAARKDPSGPGAPPSGKVTGGSAQASNSKPSDVTAWAPPLPAVSVLDVGLEAPFSSGRPDLAAAAASPGPLVSAPKRWGLSEPMECPSLAVSPRPAIRPQGGAEPRVSGRSQLGAFQTEADGPVGQKPPEDPKEEDAVVGRSSLTHTASGDTDRSAPEDLLHTANDSREEAITDEQPPWETDAMHAFGSKDSRSSSDNECDHEFEDEKAEGHHSVKGRSKPLITKPPQLSGPAEERAKAGNFSSPVAPEKPAKAQSTRSAESSGGFSFALFCFLSTTVLLLGGLGQHVWHYGLPLSVEQLAAQLELHWLEGFGSVREPCSTDCRVRLVESIPVGLYPSTPLSRGTIADSWLRLLEKANSSVHIAAFYFTLRDPSESQGRLVFEHLKRLKSKGVQLRIAVNAPQTSAEDTAELAAAGAEVREVDLRAVTGGIVHTKLWVVDQKHFYLGSANMDWRSLSQVKEVGLSVEDCSCLAQDATRIFGVYWSIGGPSNGSLPPYWPARLSALSSSQNPLRLKFNGVPAQVYLSSAPPQISARGRSDDLSTILSVIDDAHRFVHISVMDYLPLSQYTEPLRFWPAIDSVLRAAACTRDVQVRLLVSCWKHSPASMFPFLQSLLALNRPPLKCDIQVKVFTVASTAEQMRIPFARVNHAKYMVTDRVVYIGTSNWSENYFSKTAGVSVVVNQTGSVVEEGQETLQSQAEELFLRDWKSEYASGLSVDDVDVCPRSE
uniref:Phospholipase D family, member 7 n=1 Tax=Gasterosteus aculeatus aculeatus TaxID=481459 RepID=A0AAQ4P736_GASAC